MAKRSYVSVNVDIELDEIANALTDDQIRELYADLEDDKPQQRMISDAIKAANSAGAADLATMLEREFFPKWKSDAQCIEAYSRAMAAMQEAA